MPVRTPHPLGRLPGSTARCDTLLDIRSQPTLASETDTSEANGTVRVQVPVLTSRLSLPSAPPGNRHGSLCPDRRTPGRAAQLGSQADQGPAATAGAPEKMT